MLPSADAAALSAKPPVILLEGRLPVLEAPAVKALGLHDGQVVRPTVEVREGQLVLTLRGQVLPWPVPNDLRAIWVSAWPTGCRSMPKVWRVCLCLLRRKPLLPRHR